MIAIDWQLQPSDLRPAIDRLWTIAAPKLLALDHHAERLRATPVFTVRGEYVAQGWTEWTQGFQIGAPILLYDATGDDEFLSLGKRRTREHMANHVTHIGVHDHGFHQISTYGNLWRLLVEGRYAASDDERAFYELALRASGAVQAARWSTTDVGGGYIHSFNGPHSLFSDTLRSLRVLALAHQLGQTLWSENDRRVSLLERLITHARTTARYNVYYGEGRDAYDVAGRVVHESIFNTTDGCYRCPSTQQGYSPFSTWTRGLAWIMLGYAEQLEYFATLDEEACASYGGRAAIVETMERAARVTCDYYVSQTPSCGVPYWDTGAPGLRELGDYLHRPADPFNAHEPVDSSAAAIAAQGLLRLGHYLAASDAQTSQRYTQAGLTILRTLLQPPYLCDDPHHQGLLLHVVYHRPRGWDHVPPGAGVPSGESAQWGDYHLLELALYVQRLANHQPYLAFFGPRST